MAGALAGPDLAGLLDGAAEEEELFGDGGLAGIRVADDGEGSSFLYFLLVEQFHKRTPFMQSKGGLQPALGNKVMLR